MTTPVQPKSADPLRILCVVLVATAFAISGPAQCSTNWQPGEGLPGVNGTVLAMTDWDPDGPGPLPTRVVVGGDFTVAGRRASISIASWDPTTNTWAPLGLGLTGTVATVRCLASDNQGGLYAGGVFSQAGTVAAANVARWDGSSWSALGTGLGQTQPAANAMLVLPDGSLIVGGSFGRAGGVLVDNIARWNGSSWSALGFGHGLTAIHALVRRPNGHISAGGEGALGAHDWDGATWTSLGGGGDRIYAMAVLPNGHLVTAGDDMPGNIWRWTGSLWQTIGSGPFNDNPAVRALEVMADGSLLAAGRFSTLSGPACRNIARWNGTTWLPLGGGLQTAFSGSITGFALLALPNGQVLAGGSIGEAEGHAVLNIGKWNGANWSAVGDGLVGRVTEIAPTPDGGAFVGGGFSRNGTSPIDHVARVDENGIWSPLGSGVALAGSPVNAYVGALALRSNGELIAGGSFTAAGGVPASNVARWNGSTWSALGAGTDGPVLCAAVLPDDSVVIGGSFTAAGGSPASGIARWNGTAWSALGTGVAGGFGGTSVLALAVDADGSLFAGGNFTTAGGMPANGIARWRNSAWSSLGSGVTYPNSTPSVNALCVRRNGELIAGGLFTSAGGVPASHIARWNGAAWSGLGGFLNGQVLGLAELPSGDVVATGTFTTPGSRIARWNGTAWFSYGDGLTTVIPRNHSYFAIGFALAVTRQGRMLAGGEFSHAAGLLAVGLAAAVSGCPATSNDLGGGCSSTVGPVTLATDALPWLGGSYRSVTRGFAPNSIGISVFGTTPANIALTQLHPTGGANCALRSSTDSVDLLVPAAGSVARELVIPLSTTLVGVTLRHQVLQMEVNGALLTRFTGSNVLRLTIGAF